MSTWSPAPPLGSPLRSSPSLKLRRSLFVALRAEKGRSFATAQQGGAARSVRSIGEVLPEVLTKATEQHQQLLQLQRRWTAIVGTALAAHTRVVAFRRGTLYVQTDEPGSSYLLHLDKPQLLRRLNIGRRQRVVEALVIRAGAVGDH